MECIQGDDCYKVLDLEQYIIFYFTASWCGPCQQIYPQLLELIKKIDSEKIISEDIDKTNRLNFNKGMISFDYKTFFEIIDTNNEVLITGFEKQVDISSLTQKKIIIHFDNSEIKKLKIN